LLIGVTFTYEIKLNRKLELHMYLGRETRPIKSHDVFDLSISHRYPLAEFSNACCSTRLRTFISGTLSNSSDATLYLKIVTTLIYRGCNHLFGSVLL